MTRVVVPSPRDASGPVRGLVAGLHAVYQPIVDLRTSRVVAYEALARGRAGTPLHLPGALFERARADGVECELDWHCQAAALAGALRDLPAGHPVFVNVEPRWVGTNCPAHLLPVFDEARERLPVVVEITERSLVADPAGLLAAVARLRASGWGIALDDVGADPASLALMPFVEPDVVKLDLALVQRRTSSEMATVVNAVAAHAERTGATVLAEGIETPEHRDRALSMGATLGQGWLFGRPAPLPPRTVHAHAGPELPLTRAARRPPVTPFAALEGRRRVQEAAKHLLMPMSHHLERHALTAAEPPVLLAAFEDARHFTPATGRRYSRLGGHCSLVAALAVGLSDHPVPGVRGAGLAQDDPLHREWTVTTVGPHFAGALIARDLGDGEDGTPVRDGDRRFAFAVTHDRDLVLDAARSLMSRVAPLAATATGQDAEDKAGRTPVRSAPTVPA